MMKIRIGGWAGQGTVRAGTILGKSLSIEQDYNVVQKWSYSAAVRSGIAYSDVIADEDLLDELVVDIPDYLLVMYQNTLDEWKDMCEGVQKLIVDSSRVKELPDIPGDIYRVPAAEIAEEIATPKAANVVLLGSLAGISESIDIEGLKKTVKEEFPNKYVDLNIEALEKGYHEVR